jgi:uncharacterized membrane protein YeaQ/YmgE (transglycosylase-associated protein family)
MNWGGPEQKKFHARRKIMGSVVGWIVFGFVVGVIARFILPGPQPMGIIVTTLLGIAGSFVGGYLGHLIKGGDLDAAQPANWIGSIVGAILLLIAFHFVRRRTE